MAGPSAKLLWLALVAVSLAASGDADGSVSKLNQGMEAELLGLHEDEGKSEKSKVSEEREKAEGSVEPAAEGAGEGNEKGTVESEVEREGGEEGVEGEGEGAEEGGEEGEEEGEEEEFTPVDINAAVMLLGGVTFVMSLFQLVNVDDDDVRRYAWKVISSTVAIFMAVLFFQGNNEMLVTYTTSMNWSEITMVFIHFAHCTVYIICLILYIGYNSGVWEADGAALDAEAWVVGDAMLVSFGEEVPEDKVRAVVRGDKGARRSVYTDAHGLEVAVVKKPVELENRLRRNACWATLLAHMAGFAAIAAGGSMQQSQFFKQNPALCLIPVLLTILFLIALFQGTSLFRAKLRRESVRPGRPGRRAKMVDVAVSEAENDILSLVASFLTIQACRFAITGQLPNAEGLEEPMKFKLSQGHVMALSGTGLLFVIASLVLAWVRPMLAEDAHSHGNGHAEVEEEGESTGERVVNVMMNICTMCFAWCALMSSRWAWMLAPVLGIHVHSIDGRIMLALILSLFTFIVVYFLDKIDDALRRSNGGTKMAEHAISSIIGAFTVLVGFSWEHSFDGALTAVADLNEEYKQCTKFALGICVFAFLLKPWRRYILRRALQLEELKKDREHASATLSTDRTTSPLVKE